MAESAVLIKAAYDEVGIRTTLDPLPAAVYSERKVKRQLMCQVDNFQWPWIADTGYTRLGLSRQSGDQREQLGLFRQSRVQQARDRDDADAAGRRSGPRRISAFSRSRQRKCPGSSWSKPGWREAFKKEWTNFHWYPDNNVHSRMALQELNVVSAPPRDRQRGRPLRRLVGVPERSFHEGFSSSPASGCCSLFRSCWPSRSSSSS